MRALATIIIIGLVGLSVFNWMQIQTLRKDVSDLRKGKPVAAAPTVGAVGDHARTARDLVERASKHMAEANGYIEKKDLPKAKAALDEAIQELDTAASLISDKPTEPDIPLIDRLRGAADMVEKHLPRKGDKK